MPDRPRIRVWRVAVFLLLFVAFDVSFDLTVPNMWVNVPVEMVYGTFLELMVLPTFGLRWCIGELRDARRELRRVRREIGGVDA